MNTPVRDFLEKYAASDSVRCHMPGSKGLSDPFDITEIEGADELFASEGIIRESEMNAAALFGSAAVCYSCGGSTLCIQAMLAAAKAITGKSTVIAGRYSHKSLIGAAVLLGLRIKWVYPGSFLSASLDPREIGEAVDADTAAVFVTAVDYYGSGADIAAISAVCRKNGVLLLCDNAHGAYKVFTGDHPIKNGADFCCDSAHKTLPAPTGTAYLHLSKPEYLIPAKAAMSLFGSSSPPYPMLCALDCLNGYISREKAAVPAAVERIRALKQRLADMGFVLRKSDDMRIVTDAAAAGYTGTELAKLLRAGGIECEMSDERYVILLFSTVQPEGDFERIAAAFGRTERKAPLTPEPLPVLCPAAVMTPREAYFSARREVPTKDAVGRVCAGIHCPCPPCVPPVMPGERIDLEAARLLLRFGTASVSTADVN